MNTRVSKNWVILFLLAIYAAVYKFFILQYCLKYSKFISCSFLMIVLILSIIFLGFRRDKVTIVGKRVFKTVLFYIITVFLIMYILGIIAGFTRNTYSGSFLSAFDRVFIPIFIILLVEFIRYIFISANKDKNWMIILLTIVLVVLEIFMNVDYFDITNLATTFTILTTMILPCILKNFLLSYLMYNVGYRIPIIYRVIMDMYLFVFPIVPKLGDYVNSIILISLPIVIYISVFSIIDDHSITKPISNKKMFSIWDIPITIIVITLVALNTGFFPHYILGVGSNSMQPALSKGDAIILKKVNNNTKLKKGDIVAYDNGKMIIVHRIKKIDNSGLNTQYIMKGDANNGVDSKAVDRDQIKGIVKLKIPYLAWPTVWLMELLNK